MKPIGQDHDPVNDAPIAGLRQLRDVTPPPSLVPAVMRGIAEPRPLSLWGWLRRPHTVRIRLSPLGGLAVAAAATLVVVALEARPNIPTNRLAVHTPAAAAGDKANGEEELVLVRFVLVAEGARKVAVAGDFNGWKAEATVLENADGRGTFVATVPLPAGSAYEYMFLVDGEWLTDPTAPETRPDGFGRRNAILRL